MVAVSCYASQLLDYRNTVTFTCAVEFMISQVRTWQAGRVIQSTPSNPTRWTVVQDDEAELLAELARIRKEREQEAAKKAADEALQKQAALQEEVIHGNPLFPRGQPDFQVCNQSITLPRNMQWQVQLDPQRLMFKLGFAGEETVG